MVLLNNTSTSLKIHHHTKGSAQPTTQDISQHQIHVHLSAFPLEEIITANTINDTKNNNGGTHLIIFADFSVIIITC